jgi:hypothetical protein
MSASQDGGREAGKLHDYLPPFRALKRKLEQAGFGTQGDRGNAFVERILTVSATCKQQGRNVLDYVTAAVDAHLRGRPGPSLLPELGATELARAA